MGFAALRVASCISETGKMTRRVDLLPAPSPLLATPTCVSKYLLMKHLVFRPSCCAPGTALDQPQWELLREGFLMRDCFTVKDELLQKQKELCSQMERLSKGHAPRPETPFFFCLNNWDIFFRHWCLGCDQRLRHMLD